MSDEVKVEAVVEGHPYDRKLWQKCADQLRDIGNKFSIYFPDDDNDLFFDTADGIDELVDRIEAVNRANGVLPVRGDDEVIQ